MFGGPLLDRDGYPTDESLDAIDSWTGTARELVENMLRPLMDAYGGVKIEDAADHYRGPADRLILITGGWSGCESVISTLEDGFLWNRYWTAEHRGGRYDFIIPHEEWDEPLQDWSKHRAQMRRLRHPSYRALVALRHAGFPDAHWDHTVEVLDATGTVTLQLLDGDGVAAGTATVYTKDAIAAVTRIEDDE